MSWLDSLKVAILERDSQKAYELVVNIPLDSFQDTEELLSAQELIAQSIDLLEQDKEKLKNQMLQIKNAKKFLE